MAAKCPNCGAEVAEDWPVCRSCFEPVKREGLLARLKGLFSRGRAGSGSVTVNITENQVIKIRDPLTGNLREYHSIEDVPPEFREQGSETFGQIKNILVIRAATAQCCATLSILPSGSLNQATKMAGAGDHIPNSSCARP